MSILKFHTPAGQCDIIYIKDFPSRIAIQKVTSTRVHYPTYDNNHSSIHTSDEVLWRQREVTIKDNISILDMKISISHKDLILSKSNDIYCALYIRRNAAIIEEMKIMVGQKDPTIFVKDLTLDVIQNLSMEYAKNCYNGYVIGLHCDLGPYSKFFCILDDTNMRWYETEPYQEINKDITSFIGKLVNLYPDRFFMVRYENLEYLKEMNSKMRYIGPGVK